MLVQGAAQEVVHAPDVARLESLALRTWAPGAREHWIRIPMTMVSGRSIA